jgi:hypothetical protein
VVGAPCAAEGTPDIAGSDDCDFHSGYATAGGGHR